MALNPGSKKRATNTERWRVIERGEEMREERIAEWNLSSFVRSKKESFP